jgi:hypothetical protein
MLARFTVLVALILCSPALAEEECPVGFDLDAILQAVEAAPSCKDANQIAKACAFGSSGDVQTAGAVQTRCEADFLPTLKRAQARAYRAKIRGCARRYANRSGSMYQSMAAFCASDAAAAASARALRAKK